MRATLSPDMLLAQLVQRAKLLLALRVAAIKQQGSGDEHSPACSSKSLLSQDAKAYLSTPDVNSSALQMQCSACIDSTAHS